MKVNDHKIINLFNVANKNINSTLKLKRKLNWRLELISVIHNIIRISELRVAKIMDNWLKNTWIISSYSKDYRIK